MFTIGLSGTIVNNGSSQEGAFFDDQADEDVMVGCCIAHAYKVAAQENVVQDLIAGLVSEYTYTGKTCEYVKDS